MTLAVVAFAFLFLASRCVRGFVFATIGAAIWLVIFAVAAAITFGGH